MPRVLQESLRFGRAGEASHAHSKGEVGEVAQKRAANQIGAGLPEEGSGPARVRSGGPGVNHEKSFALFEFILKFGRRLERARRLIIVALDSVELRVQPEVSIQTRI